MPQTSISLEAMHVQENILPDFGADEKTVFQNYTTPFNAIKKLK